MKRVVFGLVISIGFIFFSCANNEFLIREVERLTLENAELKAHTERLRPITLEIVNQAIAAGENTLGNLDYFLSAPLMLVTNNPDTKVNGKNGVLFIEDTNFNTLDKIESSEKGKFENYYSDHVGKESFEITFLSGNKEVTLKFERDKSKNNFVFVEVVSPKNISYSAGGIQPYLCVLLDYKNEKVNPIYENNSPAVQKSPVSPPVKPNPVKPNPITLNPVKPNPVMPNPITLNPVMPNYRTEWVYPTPQQFGSRYIIDDGILTKDIIVEYILLKNGVLHPDRIETIVTTYIIEAQKEHVNHDIAIAQMCEGTDHLRDMGKLSANNYGDLQYLGNRGAINSFPSMALGIRAHIQQLKAYADPRGPVGPKVDSIRISRVGKDSGRYPTLDQLYPVWVTKNTNAYKNTVNAILDEMYRFQMSDTIFSIY